MVGELLRHAPIQMAGIGTTHPRAAARRCSDPHFKLDVEVVGPGLRQIRQNRRVLHGPFAPKRFEGIEGHNPGAYA